jgi:serine protease inhibitor
MSTSMPLFSNSNKKRKNDTTDSKSIDIVHVVNNTTEQKLRESEEKDCFFSSYGLFCLLDMLKNGSQGDVLGALTKLLGTDQTQNVFELAKSDDVFKNTSLLFHVANLKLDDNFAKYLKSNNVLCDSIELNVLKKRVTEINRQVEKMTNDKIKEPLNVNDFDQLFVMLLINVLYFKAAWKEQFEESFTEKMTFKNGKDTIVDMMNMNYTKFLYYENKSLQYLCLPYNQYPYKMVIALPKKGYKLSDVNLSEALEHMDSCTVKKLMLPKFKIETEEELTEYCTKLGLGKMFAGSNDFDSMFQNSTKPKYIKTIKQKTFIDLNEKGTEAACVTHAVMCYETAMQRKLKEVEFVADHPFNFFILGPINIVLFAGKFCGY